MVVGTAGTLGGWALKGYLVARHGRDIPRSGTAGTLGGWGTAGMLGGGHQSGSGRTARTTQTLKSNNPTARVGNNGPNPQPLNSQLSRQVILLPTVAVQVEGRRVWGVQAEVSGSLLRDV